ncbi:MAG TPA: transposase [Terriglobales bacterium]|nr:transposase [Terriglobales bacterium]
MTQQERSRKARQKWQRLVSEQVRSGQSVAAFCREHGLSEPHFYWWKKRLRESAPAKFVEVKLAANGLVGSVSEPRVTDDSRVEIRLRNGRSLVVGRGCDAEQVRVLVGVVEAA